ncbi:MAG: prepilin-type N-terminal cleavage/methylation domain-containing protein [bacterium]
MSAATAPSSSYRTGAGTHSMELITAGQLTSLPRRDSARGFTFIELLVALAILTILSTVILSSHVLIIRAQNRVRVLEESRLVTERIAGNAWIATSSVETVGSGIEGWTVRFEQSVTEDGTNQQTWNQWTISPSNNPGLSTVLYLRPAPGKTNTARGAALQPANPLSVTPRQDSGQRRDSSRQAR